MRKRIYRISEDKFDDLKPNIELETEQIEETCYIGDSFSGSFYLKSTNDVKIRGVVYCDNPYVKIAEPWFDKVNVRIDYTIDDCNFKVGETITGEFVVVAVGMEQAIPFTVTYVKRPLISSEGEIKDLKEFALLTQNHYNEAISLFYSDKFNDFIADFDKRTRLLYRG